ncbi:MAG: adenylosuccinate lyase [Desulfobacteraceae bacterium]|nr:adenylosuccinate lyase [Desulfobacteraceae bacterium]
MDSIKAISTLDGRYNKLTNNLCDIFSEYGLIKHRVKIEIEWLKFILVEYNFDKINNNELKIIDKIYTDFEIIDANSIKNIEKTTNHDVKAVEYFIKEKLENSNLGRIKEWVHFACTSDDINNIAYALMLQKGKKLVIDLLNEFLFDIEEKARKFKSVPMMSRTHGQPASPTTIGKEFINFAWRINQEIEILENKKIQGKLNGATGNFNAHFFVYPDINWIKASHDFLSKKLNLEPVVFTTQINPNASLSYVLHSMIRSAAIMIDFNRDMWGYISLGYFKQQLKKGEVGSSTMPHKVNPIDFENSEGNMGIAISIMEHLSVKLQKSRFQRDLTDSTVLRNLGMVFGYFMIGIKNSLKGLGKIAVNHDMLSKDLEANPELLAEPFQTAMRIFKEENPYEKLKELTRGKNLNKKDLEKFVNNLEKVPVEYKEKMKNLSVHQYIGLADKLVDYYFLTKSKNN